MGKIHRPSGVPCMWLSKLYLGSRESPKAVARKMWILDVESCQDTGKCQRTGNATASELRGGSRGYGKRVFDSKGTMDSPASKYQIVGTLHPLEDSGSLLGCRQWCKRLTRTAVNAEPQAMLTCPLQRLQEGYKNKEWQL